jgi:hypothetical protein
LKRAVGAEYIVVAIVAGATLLAFLAALGFGLIVSEDGLIPSRCGTLQPSSSP